MFYDALINPNMIPEQTLYNTDLQCNYETMFKSEEIKGEFTHFIEQSCYKKNNCDIDINNMVTNITYTQSEWESMSSEPYNPL